MKEKDFQIEFKNKNTVHGCFELKFCKGTSLPFSRLEDHQEKALLGASTAKGVYHKISDEARSQKPFDCFNLIGVPGYVVVMFWTPYKKKNVYYIFISEWIKMRKEADRKSMTEDMARKYCDIYQDYRKSQG